MSFPSNAMSYQFTKHNTETNLHNGPIALPGPLKWSLKLKAN